MEGKMEGWTEGEGKGVKEKHEQSGVARERKAGW